LRGPTSKGREAKGGDEREGRGREGRREGRRWEGRGGLSGNVAEEAFCLKSAPAYDFLLVIYSNPGHISYRFGEKRRNCKFAATPLI